VSQSGVSTLIFQDTSTGSDATLTERRIYLQKYDQSYLVPTGTLTDYIVWDIDDATITLTDILDKDYALDITVIWVAPIPDPAGTYEAEQLTEFDAYAWVFAGALLAQKSARYPNIVNDTSFNLSEANFLTAIRQAEKAVTRLQNIGLAQAALDITYYMRINTRYYF
jgi:hypothetical protein